MREWWFHAKPYQRFAFIFLTGFNIALLYILIKLTLSVMRMG